MRGWQRVAVALVALAGLAGSLGVARPAAAAGVQAVDVYVELSSTSPAAGCFVEVSVELRSGGAPLAGTEVVLGMVVAGELASADRGLTGANGVTYLALDTSAGWPGADGWLDVNVNGTYVGGTGVALTEDGPCAGDSRLWTTKHDVWLADPGQADAVAEQGVAAEAASSAADASTGASVWVPAYYQQRNLSCEYASLTIATGAFGAAVSEWEFDALAGWSENPHWGYRGDINGTWGNTTDYGVYAEPLAWALPHFGFYGEVFYGQGDSSALTARLDWGMPTLVWIALWGDQSYYEYTADGTAYMLVPGYHVVVAYAYDEWGVYVSDPALGDYRYYDWGTFMWMWNVLDGMSLAVAPA
jgi:uncharacterized protein YvpB